MPLITWVKNLFGQAQTTADHTKQLIADGKVVVEQTKNIINKLKNIDDLTLDNIGAKTKQLIQESKKVKTAATNTVKTAKAVAHTASKEVSNTAKKKINSIQKKTSIATA